MLLLFDFTCILRFFFSLLFNDFLLPVFFFSSMFSALLPIAKKITILSKIPLKYDVNKRLLESSVNWEKTLVLPCVS